jgi:hypothetical protein
MTAPDYLPELERLGDCHKAQPPAPQTTAEQLLEASERFVKPDGTFDARAYIDHLNAQQP